MRILRFIVYLYAAACVAGAFLLVGRANGVLIAIYLLVNATLITVGILFERGRYQPKTGTSEHEWQQTGERFVDPSTGKLMEVHYNPKTGERTYKVVDSK